MKVAQQRKKHLPSTRRAHYVKPTAHHIEEPCTPAAPDESVRYSPSFFDSVRRTANIERKQVMSKLRVSQTTADKWFSGELADPLTRARDIIDLFREHKAVWLIPSIFEYIAGNDFTDVGILTAEQQQALMVLAKAVKKEGE